MMDVYGNAEVMSAWLAANGSSDGAVSSLPDEILRWVRESLSVTFWRSSKSDLESMFWVIRALTAPPSRSG